MTKRIIITALALALTGCATIERHPLITGAALAFVGTSIALSTNHRAPGSPPQPVAHQSPINPRVH